MKNFLITVFAFLIVCAGVLFFAKDLIAKIAFEAVVGGLTGFDAKVQSLQIDLGQGIVHIQGLALFNPPEFRERIFADAPEIYFQIDLAALLKKESVHINELRLNIQELNIEKNERGISNVSLLTSVKQTQKEAAAPSEPSAKKPGMPFRLDRLELTLRRVRYNDRSSLVPKKFSVDLRVEKQVFEEVSDPKSIINIVLMKLLSVPGLAFGNLGLNPAQIQDQLETSVKTARDLGEKVFKETGTQLIDRSEVVGKKIVGEGRGEITNLFGKLRSRLKTEETQPSQ